MEDYPYHISNVWEPVSRITRITEMLNSKEQHSVQDFKKYQMDFKSPYAQKMVKYILDAFENQEVENHLIISVLKLLKQWDYKLDAGSQVPSIYAVYFQFLLTNIFEDEMGSELFNEYVFLANIPYRVVLKLLEENRSSWFNIQTTNKIESRDDIIRKSLFDAVNYLENKLGSEIKYWQWGKIHQVTFKHFFHGASSMIDNLLDIGPYEIGGDGTTVFNTEYSLTDPYKCKLGPSMRYIYDFSNPDEFEYILPTGQAGHFFSDHYCDMTSLW